MMRIGQECTLRLDIVTARQRVTVTVGPMYARGVCEKAVSHVKDGEAYYARLATLRLPERCGLHLGVIHHHDDHGGEIRRIALKGR